jgi:uncharacterized integral membrane protein
VDDRRESRTRLYVGLVALLLAIIFIVQNSQKVTVDFIFSETETPLIFALLLATVLGVIIGLVLPRFRRRD